jgi:hypothetical protein
MFIELIGTLTSEPGALNQLLSDQSHFTSTNHLVHRTHTNKCILQKPASLKNKQRNSAKQPASRRSHDWVRSAEWRDLKAVVGWLACLSLAVRAAGFRHYASH